MCGIGGNLQSTLSGQQRCQEDGPLKRYDDKKAALGEGRSPHKKRTTQISIEKGGGGRKRGKIIKNAIWNFGRGLKSLQYGWKYRSGKKGDR